MQWASQKILITGVDGFIGSHLAKKLYELKSDVNGIIHRPLQEGHSALLLHRLEDKIKTITGDVSDYGFVEDVIQTLQPRWIFHLAAQAIVEDGQQDPFQTFETNVRGTYNVISSTLGLTPLPNIIVASSDKAYGNTKELPLTENMPLLGGSFYDTSKVCADIISRSYARWSRIPICVTRCANTYGPGDLHFSRIIPDTIREILQGIEPCIRGDGTHERDYIFISDVVEGYLRAAKYLDENRSSAEVFNFGTGKGTTVVDLVDHILRISGTQHLNPRIMSEDKPAEIKRQYVDNRKAQKLLNWRPYIELSEGLAITYKWYKNYFNF